MCVRPVLNRFGDFRSQMPPRYGHRGSVLRCPSWCRFYWPGFAFIVKLDGELAFVGIQCFGSSADMPAADQATVDATTRQRETALQTLHRVVEPEGSGSQGDRQLL